MNARFICVLQNKALDTLIRFSNRTWLKVVSLSGPKKPRRKIRKRRETCLGLVLPSVVRVDLEEEEDFPMENMSICRNSICRRIPEQFVPQLGAYVRKHANPSRCKWVLKAIPSLSSPNKAFKYFFLFWHHVYSVTSQSVIILLVRSVCL